MKDEKKYSTSGNTSSDLGLSEMTKFDAKKPLRSETNEESQRPVSTSVSVKTSRGSFTIK